jgi:hypothetical protein
MRDIQEVLQEKLAQLRLCRQQIACLQFAAPLLAEEGETPAISTETSGARSAESEEKA